ncbi:MAG: hypothetical protein GY787_05205, partial [Alteromonadales bacterium]|nr:hypothetical protein [Alteromonadales bacterium]
MAYSNRTELEEFVKKYQKKNNLTNLWLAKKLNIGESTLYSRWHNPKKFTAAQLAILADITETDVATLEGLINSTVTSADPAEVKTLKQALYTKQAFITFGVLIAATLWYITNNQTFDNQNFTSDHSSFRAQQQKFNLFFQGSGKDSDLSELAETKVFHSPMYGYKFVNMEMTINGEHVEVEGQLQWYPIQQPDKVQTGGFEATGIRIDNNVALIYKVTDTPDQEVWTGTIMLDLPR